MVFNMELIFVTYIVLMRRGLDYEKQLGITFPLLFSGAFPMHMPFCAYKSYFHCMKLIAICNSDKEDMNSNQITHIIN